MVDSSTADVGGHDLSNATDDEVKVLDEGLGHAEKDEDEEEPDDVRVAKVDTELDEANTDEDRERIRKARREERARRKNNRQERVDSLERTVQSLKAQNSEMAETLNRLTEPHFVTHDSTWSGGVFLSL